MTFVGPFLKIADDVKKVVKAIRKFLGKFKQAVEKLKTYISTNIVSFDNLCASFELNTYSKDYSMEFSVKGGVYIGGTKDEKNKKTIDKTFRVPTGSSLLKSIAKTILKTVNPDAESAKGDIEEFKKKKKEAEAKILEFENANKKPMDASAEDKITTTRTIEVSP